MANTDLVTTQCQATSKSSGNKCSKKAIPGGRVCRYHGGAAPQVKSKAAERLRLVRDLAIDRLTEKLEDPEEGYLMDPKVQLDIITKLTKDIELLEGRATDRKETSESEKGEILNRLQGQLSVLEDRRTDSLRVIEGTG